jgi:hypothetical protein
MSEYIENELRALVDPTGILPEVELDPGTEETVTAYQKFHLWVDSMPIGRAFIRRGLSQEQRPTMNVASVEVFSPLHDHDAVRFAATLSLLAVAADEERILASDENGSSEVEVAQWYCLAGEGLAVITEHFRPRLEHHRGQAVWDGSAHVPPVTWLHRQVGRDVQRVGVGLRLIK